MRQAPPGQPAATVPRDAANNPADRSCLAMLLAGCAARDETAWRRFVAAYHPLIAGTAARLLPEDQTDLVQQVYLRLVENEARLLTRFDGCGAAFLVYLQRIIRNVACEALERDRRFPKSAHNPESLAEILADERADHVKTLASHDELELFSRMVSGLDGKYREILLLLARGWKHREIAAMLGVPIRTCLTRAKRAREKLREQLALTAGRERRKTDAV